MWLESHAELRDHPKVDLLMDLLQTTRRDTVGLLHFVWWRALTYSPSGDLSDFTDGQIARWADWDGDPGHLVSALKTAGFLTAARDLHDWDEYAGRLIDRRAANAERKRVARAASARRNGTSGAGPPDVRRTSHESPGLPDRTGPDRTLTGPDRTYHQPSLPPAEEGMAARQSTVAADVVDGLSALPDTLTAPEFHDRAEQCLEALGFNTAREVFVPDRGDGRRGRLDLVGERGEERIAFELDDRSPRVGSVRKLCGIEWAARVVVLRCPFDGALPPPPPGIDVVIGAGRAAPAEGEQASITAEDCQLWKRALDHLPSMTPGNREQVTSLEPLGRAPDGGLRLRAPPGHKLGRFRPQIARALADAGDKHGTHVQIVEK